MKRARAYKGLIPSTRAGESARRARDWVTLLAVLLSCFCVQGHAQSKRAPRVAMDATVRDFGEVFAGEELEQVFMVRNIGDARLELSEKKLAAIRRAVGKYAAVPAAAFRHPAPT